MAWYYCLMTQYKLIVIVSPQFDGTDTKKVTDLITKFLGEKATTKDLVLLGKKTLTYPIQKKLEGFFVSVKVESEGLRDADLQKQVQENTDIMRFLLTIA